VAGGIILKEIRRAFAPADRNRLLANLLQLLAGVRRALADTRELTDLLREITARQYGLLTARYPLNPNVNMLVTALASFGIKVGATKAVNNRGVIITSEKGGSACLQNVI
jgi:hypothetical protein